MKYKFYFSAQQKQLEESFGCSPSVVLFNGQEYTECIAEADYTKEILKPHNERFLDSVCLGTGYAEDVVVKR